MVLQRAGVLQLDSVLRSLLDIIERVVILCVWGGKYRCKDQVSHPAMIYLRQCEENLSNSSFFSCQRYARRIDVST